ncbi:MAG TPA: bifunctional glutamate N-acetyltransferase/amino-acid acetyltransferase ArgJ [Thiotrichales bacterium]|nr:bifunctional glutamate N-acetyltransferase/amino-acid acetyltransferase ArgJ [Thiotrichales bacterium]
MSVNLPPLPELHPIDGIRLGTVAAGIRYENRPDLVVIECAEGARAAGVFTQNAFRAAPVVIAQAHLDLAMPRLLVINTGNANAGTGDEGLRDALRTCERAAELAGVQTLEVLPFSTGVIGEPLPVERIEAGLPRALAALDAEGWAEAARGILTTDTAPKGASRVLDLPEGEVRITGICKGAGMIRPDMATMLAFIATDAGLDKTVLESLVKEAADASFNRITVDGDTSTNDACLLLATGRGVALSPDSGGWEAFRSALIEVFRTLAQAIVRDGEGATRFVTVQVEEAADSAEALAVAYTIAHSPLVKTALYAGDPNWGRILAAVGRAGLADFDITRVRIFLDDVRIVERGGRAADYAEEAGQAVMSKPELTIRVLLGRGETCERIWTTDLSHEYVTINAEYRT